MEVLPYLAEVEGPQRIWYAADEWVWHHLSLVNALRPNSWRHVREAFILGLYEHSFSSVVDRAWVVSKTDQRAMQMVTRIPAIDVVPNGVNANHFLPSGVCPESFSCTFWGCLDFPPNIQAVDWFCKKVWPLVIREQPEARFHIYGFNPTRDIEAISGRNGVTLTPNLPDIRPAVGRHQLVVLPFQSGGGVKNKLLEAASMSKPIVCSRRACNGLNAAASMPFRIVANDPNAWAREILSLWSDETARLELGKAGREWVIANHSWNAAAHSAVSALFQHNEVSQFQKQPMLASSGHH
jgi:glycosyltransferase involved in cell wall biosynthesis